MHHVDSTVLLANAEACCPLMSFQSCLSFSRSTSTSSGKVCTQQYPPLCSFRSASHTDDKLADDSSIAKTDYFSDLWLFCACARGTNNSNNETKFEHRWTNTFIRIFDLFVSPLDFMHKQHVFFWPGSTFLRQHYLQHMSAFNCLLLWVHW